MSDPWAGDDWVTVQEVDAMPREVLAAVVAALQGLEDHPGRRDVDTLAGLAIVRRACEGALQAAPRP